MIKGFRDISNDSKVFIIDLNYNIENDESIVETFLTKFLYIKYK